MVVSHAIMRKVLPAYAGMILMASSADAAPSQCSPRMRG